MSIVYNKHTVRSCLKELQQVQKEAKHDLLILTQLEKVEEELSKLRMNMTMNLNENKRYCNIL